MKRLKKEEIAELNRLISAVSQAQTELDCEIGAYNEALAEAWGKVESALQTVNDAISEANTFREEIAGRQEEYDDERSDKWRASDAGQQYSEWRDQWGEEIEEVSLDQPDELEVPDMEMVETLEALPHAPGE